MVGPLQNGQISAAGPEQLKESVAIFLAQVAFAKTCGDIDGKSQMLTGLSAAALNDLQISVSTAD